MSGLDRPIESGATGGTEPAWKILERSRAAGRDLQAEWDRRFTREAFRNPVFVDAYVAALQERSAFQLLQAAEEAAGERPEGIIDPFPTRYLASVAAVRAEGAVRPGGPPIGLFDYLNLALTHFERHASEGSLAEYELVESLLGLGRDLLEDPALSGFRIDILGAFPSRVTPPMSVVLASEVAPKRPEPPPRIELQSFIGKVFRGYKIIRALGRGGFGAVFLAEHPTLPLKRALKIFLDVDRRGPGFERFREKCFAEARLQSTLKDPNVLEVVDAFEDQGYVILVMEYVDGPNLGVLIEEKNRAGTHLEPLQVLEFAIPVARGLSHAHRLGVVHRDLKPENILLDQAHGGVPKIADFGLARHLEESGQRHQTFGHLVGTPIYMAPEQVATKAAKYDHRCDIYSFGVVLYQLSMGLPPFDDEEPLAILAKHEKQAPKPLSLQLENFPEELDRIILACLEKRPEDRFASADELLEALETCRKNLAGGITQVGKQSWEKRKSGRGRRVLALAGAALLVIAVTATVLIGRTWTAQPTKSIEGPELALREQPKPADREGPRKTEESARPDSIMPTVEASKKDLPSETPSVPVKTPSPAAAAPPKDPPPSPKNPEPKAVAVPLRDQIIRYPLGEDEPAFVNRILDVFTAHREEVLARHYAPLARDLEALAPEKKSTYTDHQLTAARDIVRLASELVDGRRKELSSPKKEIRLSLAGGGQAEGRVDHADEESLTLVSGSGGEKKVEFAKISPEEFLRGSTLPIAEVAYQGLSGDAGKAVPQALRIEKTREQTLLWYPALVRLGRLQARESARAFVVQAEELLAGSATQKDIVSRSQAYPILRETLEALAASEKEILALYPYLAGEFEAARREGGAVELLLERSYSRLVSKYPGTEACPAGATLLLAGFLASLEEGHNDLIAKRGWINYSWELRPDPATREERLLYWDVLDGGGCVLRDPAGPRSLIMGRPHPRPAEGLLLKYDFEPLGEQGAAAEWRLHLKREGGQNSYLRFDRESVSLWPFGLGTPAPEAPLASAKLPHVDSEPATHTCVLIPAEGLHVFLDGRLVTTFPKEDALIPSQLSLAVLHAKLSARSIEVKKKPENSEK